MAADVGFVPGAPRLCNGAAGHDPLTHPTHVHPNAQAEQAAQVMAQALNDAARAAEESVSAELADAERQARERAAAEVARAEASVSLAAGAEASRHKLTITKLEAQLALLEKQIEASKQADMAKHAVSCAPRAAHFTDYGRSLALG